MHSSLFGLWIFIRIMEYGNSFRAISNGENNNAKFIFRSFHVPIYFEATTDAKDYNIQGSFKNNIFHFLENYFRGRLFRAKRSRNPPKQSSQTMSKLAYNRQLFTS